MWELILKSRLRLLVSVSHKAQGLFSGTFTIDGATHTVVIDAKKGRIIGAGRTLLVAVLPEHDAVAAIILAVNTIAEQPELACDMVNRALGVKSASLESIEEGYDYVNEALMALPVGVVSVLRRKGLRVAITTEMLEDKLLRGVRNWNVRAGDTSMHESVRFFESRDVPEGFRLLLERSGLTIAVKEGAFVKLD